MILNYFLINFLQQFGVLHGRLIKLCSNDVYFPFILLVVILISITASAFWLNVEYPVKCVIGSSDITFVKSLEVCEQICYNKGSNFYVRARHGVADCAFGDKLKRHGVVFDDKEYFDTYICPERELAGFCYGG